MKTNRLLVLIALTQTLLAIRVIWRMVRTVGGERIEPVEGNVGATLLLSSCLTPRVAAQQRWQDALVPEVASPACALEHERVSVIVPVLNERDRLSPCLEGLIAQGEEVAEIVVVDGGSDDGTQQLVCTYAQSDPRVRLVDASPIPTNWNGKAWGLQVGLCSAGPDSGWILST